MRRARSLDTALVRQFLKYGVVGASNTAITFAVYVIAVKLGMQYLLASTLGYLIGSVNSYLLNRHWTFRAQDAPRGSSASRFAVVQAAAIGSNLGLLYLLVSGLRIEKILAQAIVTILVLSVTFGVNRAWAFAHPGKPLTQAPGAR